MDEGAYKNFIFSKIFYALFKETIKGLINGNTTKKTYVPDIEAVSETVRVKTGDALISLPGKIQTAPLDRTDEETHIALVLFENSIKLVSQKYPKAKIGVVFIPSPGTTYRFAPGFVDIESEKHPQTYSTDKLAPASNILCNQIRTITERNKLHFYDTRLALRQEATRTTIHGPADWNHFSESGYRILTKELLGFYNQINNEQAGGVFTGSCSTLD